MSSVILALARFRSNQKEAMSKNFVRLAQELTKKNNLVTTITPTPFLTHCPIKQTTYRQDSEYSSLVEALLNLIKTCFLLNQQIEQEQPDAINIHIATPFELFIIYVFLKSKHHNKVNISIWQSYLSVAEFRRKHLFFLRHITKYVHILALNSFLTAPIYRLLLKKFNHIIVHNRYQHSQLKLCSNTVVHLVPNGIISKNFPVKEREKHHKTQLLYIGHAKPSKGVDSLIKLAAEIDKNKSLMFHLTICLSGFGNAKPIEALVEQLELSKHVTFKSDIDVMEEMSKADLLILPLNTCIGTSLTPNTIIEASAASLPIAIPSFAELKGIIDYKQNAIEIDLNDLAQSAINIEKNCTEDNLAKLSANQRKLFMEQYHLEAFISGYTQILGVS